MCVWVEREIDLIYLKKLAHMIVGLASPDPKGWEVAAAQI